MREVPAVNIWQGTSDDFSNAAYWTDGIPTADDILVLSGTPVQPPSPPPPVGPPVPNPLPVTPPSPTNSNVSLTFPTSGGANYLSSYAGIRILNGYTGTATFPANVGFGEWTQNSGATSQAADTTVTVTSTFGWVGGAINASSGNAATMKLSSVTNGQIGEDATNLSTGSTLLLDSTSTVQQAGVLNQLNGLPIRVAAR